LVIWVVVTVFFEFAMWADVVYMYATAATFGRPVVSFSLHNRNVLIRDDGSPSILVLRFVPSVSVLEFVPKLFFRLVYLLAVTIQQCSPHRNSSCSGLNHDFGPKFLRR